MRLFLLTTLTMIAFAANSVLNRLAVDAGGIDPSSFAMIRVIAGAVALGMILTVRGGGLPRHDIFGGLFTVSCHSLTHQLTPRII